MLSSIKQRMDRNEDEGFTLIELMVVLLIIAILLAIAIPTFLGARNTANARSTQENLRNALTAEQTTWTNTQAFTTDASSLEPSLSWLTIGALTEGGKNVNADLNGTTDTVVIQGYAKDGNCYAIYQSNGTTSGTDFTAYSAYPGACTAQSTGLPASSSGLVSMKGAVPSASGSWFSGW